MFSGGFIVVHRDIEEILKNGPIASGIKLTTEDVGVYTLEKNILRIVYFPIDFAQSLAYNHDCQLEPAKKGGHEQ